MVILGLTGSIGMGKSTAATAFRRLGVPIHDADQVVHDLMAKGGAAVAAIAEAFPEAVRDGAVDRPRLARRVFGDPRGLARLEAILHPMVQECEMRFLGAAARAGAPVVVLDVPLLFETGTDARCDAVVVVSAPSFVQMERVLRRPGMTRERFDHIRTRQMDDAKKRRRADFVVPTGLGKGMSLMAVRRIVSAAHAMRGRRWPPHALRRRLPRHGVAAIDPYRKESGAARARDRA